MNQLFHTAPISLNDWLHIIVVGFTIHMVIAFDKKVRLWLEQRIDKTGITKQKNPEALK